MLLLGSGVTEYFCFFCDFLMHNNTTSTNDMIIISNNNPPIVPQKTVLENFDFLSSSELKEDQ